MWQSKNKKPFKEWEYLVKIDKYYHIWYCEFDWVWTIAWIVSNIDKWREIENTDSLIWILFLGAILGMIWGMSVAYWTIIFC